jgi:hypothetical protein
VLGKELLILRCNLSADTALAAAAAAFAQQLVAITMLLLLLLMMMMVIVIVVVGVAMVVLLMPGRVRIVVMQHMSTALRSLLQAAVVLPLLLLLLLESSRRCRCRCLLVLQVPLLPPQCCCLLPDLSQRPVKFGPEAVGDLYIHTVIINLQQQAAAAYGVVQQGVSCGCGAATTCWREQTSLSV